MNLIRTLLMLVFWTLATIVAGLIAIPYAMITKRVEFLYRVGVAIARLGVRIVGVEVVPEGLERLDPHRTYIFMSNHVSNMDPPVLLPLVPRRTSVLAKRELFRVPILGRAMRLASLVPVDRSRRERAIESLDFAGEVLRTGINMMIFVEGTRSRDGHLQHFKKGPFHLAIATGVPVVPVTIVGTYASLPKGNFIVHRGRVRVVFHAPLDPRQFKDLQELSAAVRDGIASAL